MQLAEVRLADKLRRLGQQSARSVFGQSSAKRCPDAMGGARESIPKDFA